jgi:hypothetical protein
LEEYSPTLRYNASFTPSLARHKRSEKPFFR